MNRNQVFILCLAGLGLLLAGCQLESAMATRARHHPTGESIIGLIESNDPRFDQLVPPSAKIQKLAEGFAWAEGPIWIKDQGCLLFCEHGDRRIARLEKDGRKTTLAGRYQGKRFNSPNDLVYKSNGDLYFTDPPYGLEGREKDPKKELQFQGVYRLKPNGELTLLVENLTFPNGLAFSPDEKILYVAVSDPAKAVWMAYDVKPDGTVANGRVFFDATAWVKTKPGLPDGMKVDRDGNLFATGPGGVLVFAPNGKHLGTIDTGEPTANCNWGDDGSMLYITANHYLCRIRTKTKGAGF